MQLRHFRITKPRTMVSSQRLNNFENVDRFT